MRLLFGLAPGGVCHALDVTIEAVRSYHPECAGKAAMNRRTPKSHNQDPDKSGRLFTIARLVPRGDGRPQGSPLPEGLCVFCGTFRRVTPPGCYPAPCPVESGLSSPRSGRRATVQPAPHESTIRFATREVNALGGTNRQCTIAQPTRRNQSPREPDARCEPAKDRGLVGYATMLQFRQIRAGALTPAAPVPDHATEIPLGFARGRLSLRFAAFGMTRPHLSRPLPFGPSTLLPSAALGINRVNMLPSTALPSTALPLRSRSTSSE
jgi:hypothetical protein